MLLPPTVPLRSPFLGQSIALVFLTFDSLSHEHGLGLFSLARGAWPGTAACLVLLTGLCAAVVNVHILAVDRAMLLSLCFQLRELFFPLPLAEIVPSRQRQCLTGDER